MDDRTAFMVWSGMPVDQGPARAIAVVASPVIRRFLDAVDLSIRDEAKRARSRK